MKLRNKIRFWIIRKLAKDTTIILNAKISLAETLVIEEGMVENNLFDYSKRSD